MEDKNIIDDKQKVLTINREILFHTSIFLNVFTNWNAMQNEKSFLVLLREKYKELNFNVDVQILFKQVMHFIKTSMSMQCFVYMYESLKNNIDDGVGNYKESYKAIKEYMDYCNTEKLTNPKFLMDIIRSVFAHNDDLNPKWAFDDSGDIIVKKLKKDKNFSNLKINYNLLMILISVLFQNEKIKNKYNNVYILDVDEEKLKNYLNNNTLKENLISKIITQRDYTTKRKINMDSFQRKSLYNCFDKSTFLMNNLNSGVVAKFFPAKQNCIGLSNDLYYMIKMLDILEENYYSYKSFVYECYKLDLEKNINNTFVMFGDSNKISGVLMSNFIFTIFSMISVDKIAKCINDQNIDVKKVRNSVMHGRFFYNYDGVFEFYDYDYKKKYDDNNSGELCHIASIKFGKFIEVATLLKFDNDLFKNDKIL